jgi:hypothetical protein
MIGLFAKSSSRCVNWHLTVVVVMMMMMMMMTTTMLLSIRHTIDLTYQYDLVPHASTIIRCKHYEENAKARGGAVG